jgi:hypothetical protein
MAYLKLVVSLLSLITAASAFPLASDPSSETSYLSPLAVCEKIAEAISPASSVYYPGDALAWNHNVLCTEQFLGSTQYLADISHYGNSSTQFSTCSVEPGCPTDVGIIVWQFDV